MCTQHPPRDHAFLRGTQVWCWNTDGQVLSAPTRGFLGHMVLAWPYVREVSITRLIRQGPPTTRITGGTVGDWRHRRGTTWGWLRPSPRVENRDRTCSSLGVLFHVSRRAFGSRYPTLNMYPLMTHSCTHIRVIHADAWSSLPGPQVWMFDRCCLQRLY